ncbi:hypothetical protein Zmor_003338 [Zophobas morio]|uniref:Uncharacterized protein n=1 Tax=Zophobas morio TaxID=2755281 RepID=A0AA38HLR6_9CUCU|nr:hypothetical protein Zmor_003338 [Zophobas morio]
MLPGEEHLIYKYFPKIVATCNLVREEDNRHNNRLILFKLLKLKSENLFNNFVASLRECQYTEVADKLEYSPVHATSVDCDTSRWNP